MGAFSGSAIRLAALDLDVLKFVCLLQIKALEAQQKKFSVYALRVKLSCQVKENSNVNAAVSLLKWGRETQI